MEQAWLHLSYFIITMETNYTAQAQALSTAELQAILLEHHEYEPQAVLAVIGELQKRGESTPEAEQLQQELLQQVQHNVTQEETLGQKAKGYLAFFVPQRNYIITPIILYINVLAFILGAILGLDPVNPDAQQLVKIGANFGPYTLTGEWWRLLTSMFLHGGILHLLLNMMALVNIGMQLEALVGKTQFLLAYLLCGIAGSIASLWWVSPEISVSVGASGAIFGMFGMLLILLLLEREHDWNSKRGILTNMAIVIGINLAYGMRGGIDNAAHIGGLVAGLVYGFVLLVRTDRYIMQKYGMPGNAVTAGLAMAVLFGFFNSIPFVGKARWVYTMEQLVKNESIAMEALVTLDKAGNDYDSETILPMVENGIQLWEDTEVLLENVDDPPKGEENKLTAMLDYVRLRKLSYQLLRDDIKAKRPLLNQKQQQMLSAIGDYVVMLQRNDFTSLERQEVSEEEMEFARNLIKDSDGKSLDAADLEDIKEPLFILDGKEVGRAKEGEMLPAIENLDFDNIESVTVLKTEEAYRVYGEKGAWGVVVINTKK